MTGRLDYRARVAALAFAARIRRGTVTQVEVRHASDCPMLHGRGNCTCCPDIAANVDGRLWRVDSTGFAFVDSTEVLQ